jgi:hypothetical protein
MNVHYYPYMKGEDVAPKRLYFCEDYFLTGPSSLLLSSLLQLWKWKQLFPSNNKEFLLAQEMVCLIVKMEKFEIYKYFYIF